MVTFNEFPDPGETISLWRNSVTALQPLAFSTVPNIIVYFRSFHSLQVYNIHLRIDMNSKVQGPSSSSIFYQCIFVNSGLRGCAINIGDTALPQAVNVEVPRPFLRVKTFRLFYWLFLSPRKQGQLEEMRFWRWISIVGSPHLLLLFLASGLTETSEPADPCPVPGPLFKWTPAVKEGWVSARRENSLLLAEMREKAERNCHQEPFLVMEQWRPHSIQLYFHSLSHFPQKNGLAEESADGIVWRVYLWLVSKEEPWHWAIRKSKFVPNWVFVPLKNISFLLELPFSFIHITWQSLPPRYYCISLRFFYFNFYQMRIPQQSHRENTVFGLSFYVGNCSWLSLYGRWFDSYLHVPALWSTSTSCVHIC